VSLWNESFDIRLERARNPAINIVRLFVITQGVVSVADYVQQGSS